MVADRPESPVGRPLDARAVGVDKVDHEDAVEMLRPGVDAHCHVVVYGERSDMCEIRVLDLGETMSISR